MLVVCGLQPAAGADAAAAADAEAEDEGIEEKQTDQICKKTVKCLWLLN
jgi:hypothetical protein